MGLRPTKMDEKRRWVILSEAKDLLFSCTLSNIRDADHVLRGSAARDLLLSCSLDAIEGARESRSLKAPGDRQYVVDERAMQ